MKIVLIGMPGCGKSTIGRIAAEKIGAEFIDLDDEIIKLSGKSINQIFADSGEEYFRHLETDVLKDSLKHKDVVVSTGGGIVKFKRNTDAIKNLGGYTLFIDRPLRLIISDIDTSERPLLKDGAERLNNIYSERYHLYMNAADKVVINDKSIDEIVSEICCIYKSDLKRKGENV